MMHRRRCGRRGIRSTIAPINTNGNGKYSGHSEHNGDNADPNENEEPLRPHREDGKDGERKVLIALFRDTDTEMGIIC